MPIFYKNFDDFFQFFVIKIDDESLRLVVFYVKVIASKIIWFSFASVRKIGGKNTAQYKNESDCIILLKNKIQNKSSHVLFYFVWFFFKFMGIWEILSRKIRFLIWRHVQNIYIFISCKKVGKNIMFALKKEFKSHLLLHPVIKV